MIRAATTVGTIAALATLAGCGGDTTSPTLGDQIQLTSTQTAALLARVEELAPVHPDLAWLADSAQLVLKTGATADRIHITVAGTEQSYYAVGLQRAIARPTNSFATFHLIAFSDPSNPTDWVIANGYASSAGSTPPTSVTGSYGGDAVFTHLIHVDGHTATDWVATAGLASLANALTGSACSGFPTTQGVTCFESTLLASFNVTAASPQNQPSNTRTASLASVAVPGILLRFTP
jgi:hypothetical protein